jgi:hypothetical protein
MASSNFNLDTDRTKVQAGIVNVTGVSGNWVYETVTFPTPYKSSPLVTVNAPYSTGSATNWYPPMIDQITATGFRFGWYSVSGTKQVIWQAIGNI